MALKYGPAPTYIYRVLQAVKEKPTEESFNDFLAGIEVHEKKIYASAKPDMNYISGSDKRCLDAAITKYKDTDPYDLSDLSHDSAWKEARARIKDNPQKNLITIIDIARAGKANKEMIDYIRLVLFGQGNIVLNLDPLDTKLHKHAAHEILSRGCCLNRVFLPLHIKILS